MRAGQAQADPHRAAHLPSAAAGVSSRPLTSRVIRRWRRPGTDTIAGLSAIRPIAGARAKYEAASLGSQQFNTTSSMGRLTLSVLLSFAQFEREVMGGRIRDKIAASKKKGMWMGGVPPLGYQAQDRKLVIIDSEAEIVLSIFRRYAELGSVRLLKDELEAEGSTADRGRALRVASSAASRSHAARST